MTLRRVFLVLLCQAVIGWIPHSRTYYQMRVGSYCYVPSWMAPKTAASRGPEGVMFICYGEPLGTFDQGSKPLPRVVERGGRGKQGVKFRLPALIVGWRSDDVDCSWN
jgi:hypothetical protein